MTKHILAFILMAILSLHVQAQQVVIDGKFDDWNSGYAELTDAPDAGLVADIRVLRVKSDASALYVYIELAQDLLLIDDLIAHELHLYLDTDANSNTGYSVQSGYGTELDIDLSDRGIYFNPVSPFSMSMYELGFSHAPTITGNRFELAIPRSATPGGSTPLFNGNSIRILLRDLNSGDRCPNNGQVFNYTMSNAAPVLPTVDLAKAPGSDVRVACYNVKNDGLTDAAQSAALQRMVTAMDADVYAFSECYGTTAAQVSNMLNSWLPLSGPGWYVIKDDYDLITASRWPFLNSWSSVHRQFPVLIDLPDASYANDLLVINAHLNCCTNNTARQEQVDEIAAFILDAKTPGGQVDIPQNTPMVYTGDLNLVGYADQLNTLLTGTIQDQATYGSGGPLDWDGSDMLDVIPIQTGGGLSYTWQNPGSSFPPGRLDFQICSDAVMQVERAYALNTALLSTGELSASGLLANDTQGGSDHLPLVVDYSFLPESVTLSLKAFLSGPFDGTLMNDDLRQQGLVPISEPYTALGFTHVNGGGESTSINMLSASGPNAIVDWVFIELRDAFDNSQVLATSSALIQRDGDIVDTEGNSSLSIDAPPGDYYVVLKHRNHLGVMSAAPVSFSTGAGSLDMTIAGVLFGIQPVQQLGLIHALWSGDVNADGSIKYLGVSNDRDELLIAIGGSVPTNIISSSYTQDDVNMDGTIKYVGANNDRDVMLINIGGNVPTNTRSAQLP